MSEPTWTREQLDNLAEAINDISRRRIEAFASGSGLGLSSREHLQLMAEATTPDDIDVLNRAIRSITDPYASAVMSLAIDIHREWIRAGRCGVCGMTSAQAEEANYDCVREC